MDATEAEPFEHLFTFDSARYPRRPLCPRVGGEKFTARAEPDRDELVLALTDAEDEAAAYFARLQRLEAQVRALGAVPVR